MSTTGTRAQTRFYYDDESGTPVDITAHVLNNPAIDLEGVTEETTPFGVVTDKHTPTGSARTSMIELQGIFKGGSAGDPDDLFAGRVPEGPDATTRTFMIQYFSGRTRFVETYLTKYDPVLNRENGLTRYTAQLRPTGDVGEHGES